MRVQPFSVAKACPAGGGGIREVAPLASVRTGCK